MDHRGYHVRPRGRVGELAVKFTVKHAPAPRGARPEVLEYRQGRTLDGNTNGHICKLHLQNLPTQKQLTAQDTTSTARERFEKVALGLKIEPFGCTLPEA
ncbi:hypothetical protein Bbelb_218180 [Branchiostoma belcheri]|nr:hypothetical protein Bbelb_218180 [Branchiostoma belcheri]